jgi:putative tryptophan/tyrosine transport system substrate-binding protein
MRLPAILVAAMFLMIGSALSSSATVEAQPARKLPRIGVIAERASPDPMVEAFLEGLRDLGYIDGQNIVIEKRYGQGAVDKYPELAAELVGLKVDVLVVGGSFAARSAKAATTTIPIVFTSVADPVAAGLVMSLSHPGGNATGLSNIVAELSGKQLELLKLASPKISRVAVLHNSLNSGAALKVTREAARTLGVELDFLDVRQSSELSRALAMVTGRRADAILALSDPVMGNALPQLSRFALVNRLPAIYSRSEFAEEGGLLAYGPSFATSYRRAAAYVDRILKGAKPGDLPVEQPTKFELVINLKTAKALGLNVSQTILQRADRRIE